MKQYLAATALILLSASIPAAYAHAAVRSTPAAQSAQDAAEAPYDIQYLDTMAEHHREGIEMFKLAADKAQDEKVRAKAQQMIDDQQKEIPELEGMRDDVKPGAPQDVNRKLPGMKPMEMSLLEAASGSDFDRRFLDMTIQHHEGAVAMSRDALKHAKGRGVKDRARMIIDKQTKEIAELKRMRGAI